MSKPSQRLEVKLLPLAGLALLWAGATQLTGCVVRYVGPAPAPPPPAAYEAPAPAEPAATEAPAGDTDGDMQAYEPPPPLPTYEQPPVPGPGYVWTPGYWAFGPAGYYWVPGTWVMPPQVGLLWTPGYWGFVGGVYTFHAGYWGPHVGFYGGVNYGFGYGGTGFVGGRWVGNSFHYNQAVTNVNVTVVHNVYKETVVNNVTVNNTTINRVSYNGGAGGIAARPSPEERRYIQEEQHFRATPMQRQHVQQAANNPDLFARNNGGRPVIAATPHPGAFNAPGVVRAHGAPAPQPPQGPAIAHGNDRNHGYGNGNGNGNKPYGGPPPGQMSGGNAANAHPQGGYGKAPPQKPTAEKPHKAPPENGRREPETASR